MKIQVIAVSGITPLAAPDLEPGLGVPGEDGCRPLAFRCGTHQVGEIGGLLLVFGPLLVLGREALPEALQGLEAILVNADGLAPFEKVGVNEEIAEAVFG